MIVGLARALARAQGPGASHFAHPARARARALGPGPRSFALNPILSKVNISKMILCPHADFRQSQYIKKKRSFALMPILSKVNI